MQLKSEVELANGLDGCYFNVIMINMVSAHVEQQLAAEILTCNGQQLI